MAATTNAEIMHWLFSGLFLYIVVASAFNENLIMKTGIELIAEERQRQIEKEGWTPEHDAKYENDELARAAACYAVHNRIDRAEEMIGVYDYRVLNHPELWPFDPNWWKPTPDNRIKELQKAGALIAAEIDRLNAL